jgi:DNA-binding NarL/FixJ family response regulator
MPNSLTLGGMVDEKQLRILIADDNPGLREVVSAIVSDEPDMVVVAEASDVPEAVAAGAEHAPDVAILDVNMPGGGGWEAARLLLEKNPDIRLVAYSSFDRGLVNHTMKAAGVHAYVTKGSDPQMLLDAIRGSNLSIKPQKGPTLSEKMAEKNKSD